MSSIRLAHVAVIVSLLLLAAASAGEVEARLELKFAARRSEVFERVEITVTGVPPAANPFDPESIALDLQVTPPSGMRLQVPGFFHREFDRKLEGEREVLTPRGEGGWRIRCLPLEPGPHRLIATVTLGGKSAARGEAVLEVSAGTRHGLVRIEPEGQRYFRLDDGTPLFLNGLCACWHGSRGTYDYDDWLEAYRQAGMNYLKHDDVIAWHRDLGRHLRSIDPYRHLVSSSFTGGSERPDLFALPEMDFAQYHSYNEKHPARITAERAARFFEKYQKPFFVSEYGTDWKGWKPDTDPHFRALHQAIWSGAFTGAAGTGMTWWWENIHTGNLYGHWSALAAFLEGTGIGRADLQRARFENTENSVTPFGVAARDEAFVWLLDRAHDWPDGAMDANPAPVAGAKVTLMGVNDGLWAIEWWDTRAGKRVADREATASGGTLRLEPPAFQVDIAGRLKKR